MIYRGNGWEIRQGRWQDSAPESVDVTISDPPFSDFVSKNAKPRMGLYSRKARLAAGNPSMAGSLGLSFGGVSPSEIGPAIAEVSRRWAVLFCAMEQIGDYAALGRPPYVRGGWWAKTNARPQFTGDRPASPGEGIVALHAAGRKSWSGGGHKLELRGPGINAIPGERGAHETQKPLWVMLQLVAWFSDPGELVWDPYCGSGTTGVACLRLGRQFLGHEIQSHYAKIAADRLAAETRGLSLQDVRAGQTSILDAIEDDAKP